MNYLKLLPVINKAQKIAITTHVSPDADAIGSSTGLRNVLLDIGKDVVIVVPDPYPSFLNWMDPDKEIVRFSEDQANAKAILEDADLIFLLDYNNLSRIGEEMGALVGNTTALKVLVDHHQQPDVFDHVFSDTTASSTSEMIYDLIEQLQLEKHLTPLAAEALYAGIMTDTGSFRFNSTTKHTHEVTSKLLSHGAIPDKVYHLIHDQNSVERLKLLGFILDQRMTYLPEFNAVCFYLSLEDKRNFQFKKGDSEGFVNYGLSISGVVFSAFITEDEHIVKMSFRSKGDFNVNKFARAHFNGGGHNNAAGGRSLVSLMETKQAFIDLLPQYADQLKQTKVYQ